MSVWIEIQFAPKDGTPVDLWVKQKGRGRRIADCYWSYTLDEKKKRLPDGPFDGWCCDVGRPGPSGFNPYPNLIEGRPTHYMDTTEIRKGPG